MNSVFSGFPPILPSSPIKDSFMRLSPVFLLVTGFISVFLTTVEAQENAKRDKAIFVAPKNEFYEQMEQKANAFKKTREAVHRDLRVDLSAKKFPQSIGAFTTSWHTPPVSQGLTGTCWCFSTTSFFESEIHRLKGMDVKLSELWTVYWEYVEKARGYVRSGGTTEFGEGSESNAVMRIWKKYGVVPASAYSGLLPGQSVHDHRALFSELNGYLQAVKTANAWNADQVVATVRTILDKYLGEPPMTIVVDGKQLSPKEYLHDVLGIDPDDYVEIMSLMEKPYYAKAEYEVPDNWWHSADYVNVPLDDFMGIIKKAIRAGYTLSLGGDTSEPGYEGHSGVAIIPSFDIPSDYIDENAREFRFANRTTTDDHGIHLVGYATVDGKDWYLIKDSGSGSRNNSHPGYYFFQEDYVKLKMMGFTIHKDMVKDILRKVASVNSLETQTSDGQ